MKNLFPNIYAETIFNIDYQYLKNKGILNLMFDLDETIINTGDYSEINEKKYLINFFENLNNDFNSVIVTRAGFIQNKFLIKLFKINLEGNTTFVKIQDSLLMKEMFLNTKKHIKQGFQKPLNTMNFDLNNTAMIGNYPEDIIIPNLIGLKTIAVKRAPKKDEKEQIKSKILVR